MDEDILKLSESFWQFQLKESPELSTYTGYHTGNDQLDTFTVEAYESRKNFCTKNLLQSVLRIRSDERYESASFENKINLELLHQYLQTFVQGIEYKSFLLPINMYEGMDVSLVKFFVSSLLLRDADDYKRLKTALSNFNGQGMEFRSYLCPATYANGIDVWFAKYLVARIPLVSEKSFADYMIRCKAYVSQISEAIELMKTGIKQKIMPHSSGMDQALSRLENVLSSDVESTPYYKPYLNMPDSIPKDKQIEIQAEGKAIVREFVFKALEDLRHFMSEVYIPSCRTELSVCSLPDGNARYEAVLKFHCDVDLTPVQMHQLGHEQVSYLKTRIEKVLEKVDFSGTMLEFFDHIQQDPSSYFDSHEEVVQHLYDMLENTIRPKLGQLFKPAPKYDLVISDVILASAPVVAEYVAPTSEKPAVLFFPKKAVERLMKCEMACLMLHETEPGHHFQASYSVGQEDLPKFRRHKDDRRYFEVPGRFPLNTAYTEGWGLYCEGLGEELGLFNDPYTEFGYLSMRLGRAIRVVVDTGIHALRWTREQACAYMAENCSFNEERRQKEIDRYVTWPGQACAYTIGHLKINEIRKKATKKLGSAFDIKEFHEVCLKCGQVPLQILEKIVDHYIEKTLNEAK